MPDTLSFMFEENGDLKDAFRRYPEPVDTNDDLLKRRLDQWQLHNLDRIPDWEKVMRFLGDGEPKEGDPEIHRLMVLSTCHITLSAAGHFPSFSAANVPGMSALAMRTDLPGGHCDAYEYGWHIALTGEKEEGETWPDPSLQAVCEYAERHGCTHLRLDRDGPVVKDLPVYSW